MIKSYFAYNQYNRLVIVRLSNLKNTEGRYTELTEEQLAFREAHPEATPDEVKQCELNEEHDLNKYKEAAKSRMSALSLNTSKGKISDYQFLNAQASLLTEDGKGIYTHALSNEYIANYNTIGKQCRDKYYAFVEEISACETIEQVQAIETTTIEWYKSL